MSEDNPQNQQPDPASTSGNPSDTPDASQGSVDSIMNSVNAQTEEASAKSVLDQGDIDSLFQQSDKDDALGLVYKVGGQRVADVQTISVKPFDFRSPMLLTDVEMRELKMKHEKFCSYLAARLSLFLRADIKLKLDSIGTESYEKYLSTFANPAHVGILKLESLTGASHFILNQDLRSR